LICFESFVKTKNQRTELQLTRHFTEVSQEMVREMSNKE